MATLTLNYDARNKNISKLLEVLLNLGATVVSTPRKKTGIDHALEDVKKGRVNTYSSVDDLLKKIGG